MLRQPEKLAPQLGQHLYFLHVVGLPGLGKVAAGVIQQQILVAHVPGPIHCVAGEIAIIPVEAGLFPPPPAATRTNPVRCINVTDIRRVDGAAASA
jgi:hypothetical protein